jgi:glycyl-tRNA synthetase beta chain
MPELFIELFSEEIPARMQAGAAADLARLLAAALAPLSPADIETFHGPRRVALRAAVNAEVAAASSSERGPRLTAPEQAVTGFLRKHGAERDHLRQEGDYWVLEKRAEAVSARQLIATATPPLLRRFPWPKSMRWGGTSAFTWVRPLRRIVCLLDGEVVPFDLREGGDDAHGLASADLTEGHRFHAPGPVAVASCADWRETLAKRRVLVDADERKRRIARGIAAEAEARNVVVVGDPGLLDEVAGLVEWPVPLLGRIDPAYMDLPPEVMQVSMRVNQRYFTLRQTDGSAAPWFGFVANIEADDGGAAIVAGNERVLRARFADARHFWDLDRRARLADRVPALDDITFHAKLGTQGERVARLRRLARSIAPLVGADAGRAERAAELAKADLVTGMVGEFPELQGVMGRYYALHDREPAEVADAIRDHYAPKGPNDAIPAGAVSVTVALADKLDQLAGFFAIGEKPTGSGDPYALRRAGLGVIRIIRETGLRLRLLSLIAAAGQGFADRGITAAPAFEILDFLIERLRVQLRAEGRRHDVIAAALGAAPDDDLVRLEARANAVSALLGTDVGVNLLIAYRRAANILRIEERKDGPHDAAPDTALLVAPEERDLILALDRVLPEIDGLLGREAFHEVLAPMASLRGPLDAFFDRVTVNAPEPELRRNRLRLLNRVRATMNRVADFSKIEA